MATWYNPETGKLDCDPDTLALMHRLAGPPAPDLKDNMNGATESALFARCCDQPEAVAWNPFNGVVQCHACGHVWVPCVYPPAPGKP